VSPDSWKILQSFSADIEKTAATAKSLFASVSAVSGGEPVLCWEAKENIQVTLAEPARVMVRFGAGGLLDLETPLSEEAALSHQISIPHLRAGKEYTFQVKAMNAETTQFSNISVFSAPPVKALTAKPFKRSDHFITVKGTEFYDGDEPFRYVGTNNYTLHMVEPASLEYILSWAEKLGLTVVRTWAFGETAKNEKDWAGWEKRRYFTTAPGQYREAAFKDLDAVLVSASKHHLRLILALSNNWADYGGAPEWVKFFGLTDKNDFFDKPQIKAAFKDYINHMVNRVNTISGVAYKEDPTIMAWDLMNEPWYQRDTSGKFMGLWIDEMSSYLKSLGVKQLVTTGMEGYRARNGTHYSGTDFILDQQSPSIDFATFHIYPTSQYTQYNLETTQAILAAYVKDGHEILKKPVVMEEFGIEKGKPGYDRPPFIYGMLKAFYDAGGNGSNYWMLSEPNYGEGNEFDPTMPDICNVFVLKSDEIRGGKSNEQ
jgi:endo-1,4-beta-mannosidase